MQTGKQREEKIVEMIDSNTEPACFLLKLEEYEGEGSSLMCCPNSDLRQRYVFCLVGVWNGRAEIVDAGYRSAAELLTVRKELAVRNPAQQNLNFQLTGDPRYFILEIQSREWELCEVCARADNADRMFCVLAVFDNGIDVLDWGYSSVEQLLNAWNDKMFADD